MSKILDEICIKKYAPTYDFGSMKTFYWIHSKHLEEVASIDPRTNRMMDKNFMTRMKKSFDPEICDPLILTLVKESEDETLYIADGQHRFCCITELVREGRRDFPVRVDLVQLETFEDLKKYVHKINNRYNFSSEQIDQMRMENIIDELNNQFGFPDKSKKGAKLKAEPNYAKRLPLLHETAGKRVNRPRINKNVFRTELSKTGIYQDRSITTTAIVIKCGDINTFLLSKGCNFWCANEPVKEKKPAFYEQAEKAECVLGVSAKLTWMKLLDEHKSKWEEVWISSCKVKVKEVKAVQEKGKDKEKEKEGKQKK